MPRVVALPSSTSLKLVRQWLVMMRNPDVVQIRGKGMRECCEAGLRSFVAFHDRKAAGIKHRQNPNPPHRRASLQQFVAAVRQLSRGIMRESHQTSDFIIDPRLPFVSAGNPNAIGRPPSPEKKPRSVPDNARLVSIDDRMRRFVDKFKPGEVIMHRHSRSHLQRQIVGMIHDEIPELKLSIAGNEGAEIQRILGSLRRCGVDVRPLYIEAEGRSRWSLVRSDTKEPARQTAKKLRQAMKADEKEKLKRESRAAKTLAKIQGFKFPEKQQRQESLPAAVIDADLAEIL